jgi:adenylate cyclase
LAQHQQFLVLANPVEWADSNIGRGYQFVHDVYRRMLYNKLSPARRQQLHRRAAIAIELGYRGRESEAAAQLALHFELGGEPGRAVDYLPLVAEQALQRASVNEAVAYLKRALALLAALPQNAENEARELEIRLHLMRALVTALAYTATEQQDNLQRALKLCEHLQDSTSEIQILALLSGGLILRGDIQAADAVLNRAREAGKQISDPVLLSHEPLVSGVSALAKGQLKTAEKRFKRSVDLLQGADLREPTRLFGHDPTVLSLGFSTISAWLLGKPDEARRRARLALARSESIGAPQVLANGLDVALSAEHFRGDVEAARPLAAALDDCMARYCVKYPYSRPLAARNWLLLRSGDAAAAIAGISRDLDEAKTAGHGLFFPLMYITLAEACLETGATADGLAAIDEALTIVRGGERVLEAEVWRLKGELLRLEREHENAEQCFRTALAVAGEQSALSLELRAANSLVRLHRDTGRAVDAGEHLEEVLARFTEGFDTADLREAHTLCQGL